jgi:hypothetical protein
MKFEELLPVGSVVRLKGAKKKIVIMGFMPVKHLADGSDAIYDYLGVPYPEGFMQQDSGLLFSHGKIDEIVFTGYTNKERDLFVSTIQQILSKTEDVVG